MARSWQAKRHNRRPWFIQHVSNPRFVVRVALTAHENGTAIDWVQEFKDATVAEHIRHIVEPANEQNSDRLQSVLDER